MPQASKSKLTPSVLIWIVSSVVLVVCIASLLTYAIQQSGGLKFGNDIPSNVQRNYNALKHKKETTPKDSNDVTRPTSVTLSLCSKSSQQMFLITVLYPTIDDFQGFVNYYTDKGVQLETKEQSSSIGSAEPIPVDADWNPEDFKCKLISKS